MTRSTALTSRSDQECVSAQQVLAALAAHLRLEENAAHDASSRFD